MIHTLLQYRFLISVYFDGRMSIAVNGFVDEYSFIQFIKYGILYSITLNNLSPKTAYKKSPLFFSFLYHYVEALAIHNTLPCHNDRLL